MFTYIQSEPNLWTVGSYDPKGKWHAESDHKTPAEAARQVARLNGGDDDERIRVLEERIEHLEDVLQYHLERSNTRFLTSTRAANQ